jgi:hypothetical protein
VLQRGRRSGRRRLRLRDGAAAAVLSPIGMRRSTFDPEVVRGRRLRAAARGRPARRPATHNSRSGVRRLVSVRPQADCGRLRGRWRDSSKPSWPAASRQVARGLFPRQPVVQRLGLVGTGSTHRRSVVPGAATAYSSESSCATTVTVPLRHRSVLDLSSIMAAARARGRGWCRMAPTVAAALLVVVGCT